MEFTKNSMLKKVSAVSLALTLTAGSGLMVLMSSPLVSASNAEEKQETMPNYITLNSKFYDYYSDSEIDDAKNGKAGEISDATLGGIVVRKSEAKDYNGKGVTYYKEYATLAEAQADCTEDELKTLRYGTFQNLNNAMLENGYADSIYSKNRWENGATTATIYSEYEEYKQSVKDILYSNVFYHSQRPTTPVYKYFTSPFIGNQELIDGLSNFLDEQAPDSDYIQPYPSWKYTTPAIGEDKNINGDVHNTVYPLYIGDWGSDYNPNPQWQESGYFTPYANHVLTQTGHANYVRQGLVDSELKDGTITQTKTNDDGTKSNDPYKLPYFDDEFIKDTYENGVAHGAVYDNLQFPIRTYPSENGVMTYEYDSQVDSSYIDVKNDGTAEMSYTGYNDTSKQVLDRYQQKPSFLPFNKPEDSNSNALNYGFGAKIDFEYTIKNAAENTSLPGTVREGQIFGQDGNLEDLYFNFSGDDDVWVFVDGKLVLELGGIHERATGSVDFKNNKFNVNGTISLSEFLEKAYFDNYNSYSGYMPAPDAEPVRIEERLQSSYMGTNSISNSWGNHEEFQYGSPSDNTSATLYHTNSSVTSDINYADFDMLSEGTHKLTFFYMERGKVESNLSIKTNLPILPMENRVVVDESIDADSVNPAFNDTVTNEFKNTKFDVSVGREVFDKDAAPDKNKVYLNVSDEMLKEFKSNMPWVILYFNSNYNHVVMPMTKEDSNLYSIDFNTVKSEINNMTSSRDGWTADDSRKTISQITFFDGTTNSNNDVDYNNWRYYSVDIPGDNIRYGATYKFSDVLEKNMSSQFDYINYDDIASDEIMDNSVKLDLEDTIIIKQPWPNSNTRSITINDTTYPLYSLDGYTDSESGVPYTYFYYNKPGLGKEIENLKATSLRMAGMNDDYSFENGDTLETNKVINLSYINNKFIAAADDINNDTELQDKIDKNGKLSLSLSNMIMFEFPDDDNWKSNIAPDGFVNMYFHHWKLYIADTTWPGEDISYNYFTTNDNKRVYYYYLTDGISPWNPPAYGIIFDLGNGKPQTSNIEGNNIQLGKVIRPLFKQKYDIAFDIKQTPLKYEPNTAAAENGMLSLNAKEYSSDKFSKVMESQFLSGYGAKLKQTADERFSTTYKITDMVEKDSKYIDNNTIVEATEGMIATDGREMTDDAFKVYNHPDTDRGAMVNLHVSFINTPKTATLSLSKILESYTELDPDENKEFEFTVNFENVFGTNSKKTPYVGTYTVGDKTYETTNGIIKLKAGEKAIITGIPYNTRFEITENQNPTDKEYTFGGITAEGDFKVDKATISADIFDKDMDITYTNNDIRVKQPTDPSDKPSDEPSDEPNSSTSSTPDNGVKTGDSYAMIAVISFMFVASVIVSVVSMTVSKKKSEE